MCCLRFCALNAIRRAMTKRLRLTLESQNWMTVDTRLHSPHVYTPGAVSKRNQEVWSSPRDVKGDSHMRICKILSMIIWHNSSSPPSSSWHWWRSSSTASLMANGIWDATYSETTRFTIWVGSQYPIFCNEKKEYSRTMIVAIGFLWITLWIWS
jgi:hypothetical protein